MAVRMEIVYEGQLSCQAVHGPSQERLRSEAPLDNGGKGQSFSPTDLLATALGTCMLTVMGLAAKKESIDLSGTTAVVSKEMVVSPLRRVGTLAVTITFPRHLCLDPRQRQKLEEAALTCPVQQSLHPDILMPVEFAHPGQGS